ECLSMQAQTTFAVPLPRGVRRALDAMRADAGRDWRMHDLAAVAGLSDRTLQRQFRAFTGTAPLAQLREIRLDGARRELLQASPVAKVMDIALRWGFQHCGRFSIEYRRRYGETPSATLRRQVTLMDALGSRPTFLPTGRDRPTVAMGRIDASPEAGEHARAIT